jgi:hypothetical protein
VKRDLRGFRAGFRLAILIVLSLCPFPGDHLLLAQDFGPSMQELQPVDMEGDNFRVSALLFGDVFSIGGHHLGEFDGESGWWTRRVYLTTDFANFGFGDAVVRLRLEVNELDDFSTTDYRSTLKDAYVQFRAGEHRFWIGRAPTITFGAVEAHWAYRWFEKSPMDLQGIPSRLDGVRVTGPLGSSRGLYYRAAVGEGSDLGFATDGVRKAQAALTYMPEDRRFFADVFVEHAEEDEVENEDRAFSYQLFWGWNGSKSYGGLMYYHREWDDNLAKKLRVTSAYYARAIGRHWDLVGRVDYLLDPSVKGDGIDYLPFDPTARATAFFTGIDIRLHEHLNVMPNIKYITYGTSNAGERPDDDVYLGLTLSLEL